MSAPLNNHGEEFKKGLSLFNHAHFFDAHEVLEDVWNSVPRDVPGDVPVRRHLQGMVQLAVAFHHESTGNHVGACSVLERALRNLTGAERSLPDVDLERLRADLTPWRRYLDSRQHAADSVRDAAGDARVIRVQRPEALPRIALRR
jgi:predicted metal-dependent hydrolase